MRTEWKIDFEGKTFGIYPTEEMAEVAKSQLLESNPHYTDRLRIVEQEAKTLWGLDEGSRVHIYPWDENMKGVRYLAGTVVEVGLNELLIILDDSSPFLFTDVYEAILDGDFFRTNEDNLTNPEWELWYVKNNPDLPPVSPESPSTEEQEY